MRWLKTLALAILWAFFFAAAASVRLLQPFLGRAATARRLARLVRLFARCLARLLGLRIRVLGSAPASGRGHLIVANHLGYLDGIVLGALFPLAYTTKSEVRRWPLIGPWTALIGTVFIDRRHRERTPRMVEQVVERLRSGVHVLAFPEGSSTDGERMLPFQSVHFAAPLRAGAPILPVTLVYSRVDGAPVSRENRDLLYWYGEMEFVTHFWRLLGAREIEVTVRLHPAIDLSGYRQSSASRKALARSCSATIAGASLARPAIQER